MLYLVRHAMPEVRAGVPPEEWELGAEGRRSAESLRGVLPPNARLDD